MRLAYIHELLVLSGKLFQILKDIFIDYLEGMSAPITDEYPLPIIAYKEGKPSVIESFRSLIVVSVYNPDLYSGLHH